MRDRRTGRQACWRESGHRGFSPAVILCLGEPSSSSTLLFTCRPLLRSWPHRPIHSPLTQVLLWPGWQRPFQPLSTMPKTLERTKRACEYKNQDPNNVSLNVFIFNWWYPHGTFADSFHGPHKQIVLCTIPTIYIYIYIYSLDCTVQHQYVGKYLIWPLVSFWGGQYGKNIIMILLRSRFLHGTFLNWYELWHCYSRNDWFFPDQQMFRCF